MGQELNTKHLEKLGYTYFTKSRFIKSNGFNIYAYDTDEDTFFVWAFPDMETKTIMEVYSLDDALGVSRLESAAIHGNYPCDMDLFKVRLMEYYELNG